MTAWLEVGERARDRYFDPFLVRTLYRGHVRSSLVDVNQGQAQETVVIRPQRVAPAVRLEGDPARKTTVLFIFDCSGSMGTRDVNINLETAAEQKGGRERIYWARRQLNLILAELARQRNRYRVGLLAYGSRYAYDEIAATDTRPKWNFVRKRSGPNNERLELMDPKVAEAQRADPDTDYQVLLDLNDFDEAQRSIAEAKLKKLKPTGQTPLYYTIARAIEMLEGDKENTGPKRIVVITDGINQQTELADIDTTTTVSQVVPA